MERIKLTRHGLRKHPLYKTWLAMKQRCENPNNSAYSYYGGRGIKICERWRLSFANFLTDVGEKPSPEYSIDRYPDKDGDYAPGNVRWATKLEQTHNSNHVKLITFNGKTQIQKQWAEELGIADTTLITRIQRWGEKEALSKDRQTRARTAKKITLKGETKSETEWAKTLGISKPGLRQRLKEWSLERALTFPIHKKYIAHKWRRKSAMTLLELMIVIAIIAILAAMLLPVLGRAKSKARAITCLNNEKQLGSAYMQFVYDSEDRLPFADGPTNSWCPAYESWWLEETTWRRSPLLSYLGASPKTWMCPDYEYSPGFPTAMNYAVNQFIGSSEWDPPGLNNEPVKTFFKMDGQLSQHGSQIFLLIDWRREFCCGSSFLIDPHNWNNPAGFQWYSLPSVSHNHGSAFLFIDLHAEVHHFRDSRTWPVPFYDDTGTASKQPNNVDIAWIQEHSSKLK